MKKFTIVFPTRERVELLDRLLKSIQLNTNNLDAIEVIIAVDTDDHKSKLYYNSRGVKYGFVKLFVVKRSLNFSRDYYNFLAAQGTGRWIIACNDDAEFATKDWDVMAEYTLNKYIGDTANVVYGWIDDDFKESNRAAGHGKYCCFPLIGREGFNALGYVFPPSIPTWGADIWMCRLYNTIDRAVVLPIQIKHLCHHNQTREQDHISKRIAQNQVDFDITPRYSEVNSLLEALRTKDATNVKS